jgi:hypothetical protein
VFIFDHKLEFQQRLKIKACMSTEEVIEMMEKGQKYYSYHHSQDFPGMAEEGFQYFCEWVYEVCKIMRTDKKKTLFVCDEVNRFTNTSDMGYAFRQLIEDGRLQGLDFIGTSHAANQINNRLRLQLTEIVALRTIDQRPLNFLEESGFDIDKIRSLPIGAYISKDLDTDTFTEGKLFSRQRAEKMPQSEDTNAPDNQPIEDTHAISDSPEDRQLSGVNPDPE